MASEFEKFWSQPGMLGDAGKFGLGVYGALAGNREANAKVDAAQGPLYQASMDTAQGMLGRANVDPAVAAQQRLSQELGLLRDDDASSEASFTRTMQKRGLLGVNTYDTNGKAIDPKLYAFLKAREMRNAKMASDSLDKGEAAITANVNRANTAQGVAGNTQRVGMAGQNARPSNVNRNMQLAKSGFDLAKNSGMLTSAQGWLKNLSADPYQQFSGGSGLDSILSAYSDNNWWDSV
jgi:hypothetical protein